MPGNRSPRRSSGISEKHLLSILAGMLATSAGLTVLLVVALAGQALTAPQPAAANPIPVAGGAQAAPSATPENAAQNHRSMPSPSATGPIVTPTVFPTPLPWKGSGRINVLVLGVDHRDWATQAEIPRSDAIILLTLDPASKTGGILSIPRDLYVPIPGMGEYKINTAYRWGEMYKLPGGGPGTAMRTVSKLIGVPIDYYVLFDFNSFVRFIDHMGGLDMHIREEIVVDPIGPGNTVTLKPGVQALSGAVVLGYARNRHTALDDFDRSNRQQEVIMAIREQILTFNMLPELIAQAPQLTTDLASGIQTNLSLDELIRLAWLARQVPEENIRRSVFNAHKDFIYETIATPEGKQAILRLRPGRIEAIRKEFFNK